MIDIRNIDCMKLMAEFPDKHFDLAIVDPPYGIGDFSQSDRKNKGKIKWNEAIPDENYFIELKRVSKEQIIWGANYYNCFTNGGAIIWDKENPHPSMSRCEIASCTIHKKVEYFNYQWHGLQMNRIRAGIHPCEKPVALYDWILKNYAKGSDKILDTHLGSGSIAIACHYAKMDLTACEIDREYFDKAMKRFKNETAQIKLL